MKREICWRETHGKMAHNMKIASCVTVNTVDSVIFARSVGQIISHRKFLENHLRTPTGQKIKFVPWLARTNIYRGINSPFETPEDPSRNRLRGKNSLAEIQVVGPRNLSPGYFQSSQERCQRRQIISNVRDAVQVIIDEERKRKGRKGGNGHVVLTYMVVSGQTGCSPHG